MFAAYAIFAAFGTYFCMYAYRKPFAAGRFEGSVDLPGGLILDEKIVLVVAQLLGYMASKLIGIKVVSELSPRRRGAALLLSIGVAQAALVAFALTPRPFGAFWLFVNGLPLGMVWGLVFGFLEGRRMSELLGAGLSASYIVASGAVKSAGKWTIDAGVSETAMPAVVGFAFAPVLLIVVYLLVQLPPPTSEDIAARVARAPMDGPARAAFFRRFFPGLFALTFLYFFLTAYRDFRDNFARELWDALGYADAPAIFALSELPVAAGVLFALSGISLIRDNRRALDTIHLLMAGGAALIGLATFAYQAGGLDPAAWMVLVGLGLYIAYVPYGCVLFDRLIATVGVVATAGFMIYVTDAVGYAGTVALYLYKTFAEPDLSWRDFFVGFSYVTSAVCTLCFGLSWLYFRRTARRGPDR